MTKYFAKKQKRSQLLMYIPKKIYLKPILRVIEKGKVALYRWKGIQREIDREKYIIDNYMHNQARIWPSCYQLTSSPPFPQSDKGVRKREIQRERARE